MGGNIENRGIIDIISDEGDTLNTDEIQALQNYSREDINKDVDFLKTLGKYANQLSQLEEGTLNLNDINSEENIACIQLYMKFFILKGVDDVPGIIDGKKQTLSYLIPNNSYKSAGEKIDSGNFSELSNISSDKYLQLTDKAGIEAFGKLVLTELESGVSIDSMLTSKKAVAQFQLFMNCRDFTNPNLQGTYTKITVDGKIGDETLTMVSPYSKTAKTGLENKEKKVYNEKAKEENEALSDKLPHIQKLGSHYVSYLRELIEASKSLGMRNEKLITMADKAEKANDYLIFDTNLDINIRDDLMKVIFPNPGEAFAFDGKKVDNRFGRGEQMLKDQQNSEARSVILQETLKIRDFVLNSSESEGEEGFILMLEKMSQKDQGQGMLHEMFGDNLFGADLKNKHRESVKSAIDSSGLIEDELKDTEAGTSLKKAIASFKTKESEIQNILLSEGDDWGEKEDQIRDLLGDIPEVKQLSSWQIFDDVIDNTMRKAEEMNESWEEGYETKREELSEERSDLESMRDANTLSEEGKERLKFLHLALEPNNNESLVKIYKESLKGATLQLFMDDIKFNILEEGTKDWEGDEKKKMTNLYADITGAGDSWSDSTNNAVRNTAFEVAFGVAMAATGVGLLGQATRLGGKALSAEVIASLQSSKTAQIGYTMLQGSSSYSAMTLGGNAKEGIALKDWTKQFRAADWLSSMAGFGLAKFLSGHGKFANSRASTVLGPDRLRILTEQSAGLGIDVGLMKGFNEDMTLDTFIMTAASSIVGDAKGLAKKNITPLTQRERAALRSNDEQRAKVIENMQLEDGARIAEAESHLGGLNITERKTLLETHAHRSSKFSLLYGKVLNGEILSFQKKSILSTIRDEKRTMLEKSFTPDQASILLDYGLAGTVMSNQQMKPSLSPDVKKGVDGSINSIESNGNSYSPGDVLEKPDGSHVRIQEIRDNTTLEGKEKFGIIVQKCDPDGTIVKTKTGKDVQGYAFDFGTPGFNKLSKVEITTNNRGTGDSPDLNDAYKGDYWDTMIRDGYTGTPQNLLKTPNFIDTTRLYEQLISLNSNTDLYLQNKLLSKIKKKLLKRNNTDPNFIASQKYLMDQFERATGVSIKFEGEMKSIHDAVDKVGNMIAVNRDKINKAESYTKAQMDNPELVKMIQDLDMSDKATLTLLYNFSRKKERSHGEERLFSSLIEKITVQKGSDGEGFNRENITEVLFTKIAEINKAETARDRNKANNNSYIKAREDHPELLQALDNGDFNEQKTLETIYSFAKSVIEGKTTYGTDKLLAEVISKMNTSRAYKGSILNERTIILQLFKNLKDMNMLNAKRDAEGKLSTAIKRIQGDIPYKVEPLDIDASNPYRKKDYEIKIDGEWFEAFKRITLNVNNKNTPDSIKEEFEDKFGIDPDKVRGKDDAGIKEVVEIQIEKIRELQKVAETEKLMKELSLSRSFITNIIQHDSFYLIRPIRDIRYQDKEIAVDKFESFWDTFTHNGIGEKIGERISDNTSQGIVISTDEISKVGSAIKAWLEQQGVRHNDIDTVFDSIGWVG